MKIKFDAPSTKKPRPVFTPFSVTFDLEEPNDLFYLLAMINVSDADLKKCSDYMSGTGFKKPSYHSDWEELDDIANRWREECRRANVHPNYPLKDKEGK